jgi:hypothetical protein
MIPKLRVLQESGDDGWQYVLVEGLERADVQAEVDRLFRAIEESPGLASAHAHGPIRVRGGYVATCKYKEEI